MFLCDPSLKDVPLNILIGQIIKCETGDAKVLEIAEPGAVFTVTSVEIISSGIDKPMLEVLGTIVNRRGRFRLVDHGLNPNAMHGTLGSPPAFEDIWEKQ
jgi:hypothetical protein